MRRGGLERRGAASTCTYTVIARYDIWLTSGFVQGREDGRTE